MFRKYLILFIALFSTGFSYSQKIVLPQGSPPPRSAKDIAAMEAKNKAARESLKKGLLMNEQEMIVFEALQRRRADNIRNVMQSQQIKNKDSARKVYDQYYDNEVRSLLNKEQLVRWEQLQVAKQRAIKENRARIEEMIRKMNNQSTKSTK